MDFPPDISFLIAPIDAVFTYIFPEYPPAGLVVCAIAVFLFVFYMVKAGIKQGLKIGLVALGVMVFVMFVIHSLYKLLFHIT